MGNSRNGSSGRRKSHVCYNRFFFCFSHKLLQLTVSSRKKLRRFPLNVRAISVKVIYQKSTQRTVTFCILFETSYCNSFISVTARLNSKAISRNLMSNLVRIIKMDDFLF